MSKHKGEPCQHCKRSGPDLKIPCPGYPTAGDLVDWSKRRKPATKKERR